ncbi:MAG: heavy metal translocating P-type ATPase [Prevotella sp.]|nr:heavy metal translocating P-type ATPase [Prevotella sp.]
MKKTFAVLGMMCAGCSARVERTLAGVEGVREVSVSLPGRTALVDFDETRVTAAQLKEAVGKAGYDMVIDEERNVEAIERRSYEQLRRKVLLSWLFAVLCMAISMGWLFPDASAEGATLPTRNIANQTMFIIALLNLVYCGRQFYVSAWRQLLHRSANMDTLVALSTGISFLYSTVVTFLPSVGEVGGGHTFFDASIMIITFVLTGRLLEERAKNSTATAIRSLMGLQPKTARVVGPLSSPEEAPLSSPEGDTNVQGAAKASPRGGLEGASPRGGLEGAAVPLSALQQGDIIEVRAGEKIPVDGVVVSGEGRVDESAMTGEAELVAKTAGDPVLSGTMVKDSVIRFKATQVGKDTVLSNMIRMVQEAQGSKAPVQRVVDKVALVFVPTVGVIALLTFLLWYLLGAELSQAILSAVSVLVIACPCALGLATPTALMVGIGKAAQHNILIKDATALELIHRVNAMVVDKTGTITAPMEAPLSSPEEAPLSSPEGDTNVPCAAKASPRGGLEGAPSGLEGAWTETLRPHAREVISELRQMGIDIYMMSGDKEEKVSRWAREAGIEHWQSGVMPQDKENLVRRLQREGKTVAMVGDGVNDSQALAAADVSIAMGGGTDVAMDVAQLTLMGNDLRRIPEAIRLSRRTVGMIRQNLFWAFIYNIICIPLAAGALRGICDFQITPMWAAALMAMSSVSVVLNSLRLYGGK